MRSRRPRLCRSALGTFTSLGCESKKRGSTAHGANLASDAQAARRQSGGAILDLYNDPAKRALMKPEAIFEVESGLRLMAFDIRSASVARTRWYNAVRQLFEHFDYLVAPTAQIFPFDASPDWPHEIGGAWRPITNGRKAISSSP